MTEDYNLATKLTINAFIDIIIKIVWILSDPGFVTKRRRFFDAAT